MFAKTYPPSALVKVRRDSFVSTLVTCTWTFGSAAPLGSVTVPTMRPGVDPSGAALPNVQVQVTSVETNESRLTLTSAEGGYVFANIGIGVYELSAEAPGFKRFLQSPIQLLVDQVVRVDIRMALGDVAEQVTVSGEVPLIETERSGIGKVVENATIVELPLNGRHFVRLASLIP